MGNSFVTGGLIIDVIVIAILLAMAIRGFYKGAATILFEFFCTIVAVIFSLMIFKPVSNVIIEKTTIDEFFSNGIYDILSSNCKEGELIKAEETNMSKELVQIINKYLSEALNKSADSVFKYVSVKLSHLMVNLLTLIFIIIVLRIGLSFLKIIVDILAKLPIIEQINHSGGMAIGLIKGLLVIYVIFAIFSAISPVIEQTGILGMIKNSKLSATLYNNNLILKIISKGL